MLLSNGSVQHQVFIFAGYSENMEEFLDMNIGLRRRIKLELKFIFQDYSPVDLSSITLTKLLKYYLFMCHSNAIKYTKEDLKLAIKLLIENIGVKTKYVHKSTQPPHEVCLHIPGVVVIPVSPL